MRHRRVLFVTTLTIAAVVASAGVIVLVRQSLSRGCDFGADTTEWAFEAGPGSDISLATDFDDVVREDGERPLTVGSGGLTKGGAALRRNSATYLQKQLACPVNRIGVTASFPAPSAGANGGVIGLLVGSRPVPTDPVGNESEVPDLGIHFSFDAKRWVMGLWQGKGGGLITLGSGDFPVPLVRDCSVEITRRSDEVNISLPDGTSHRFQDPRIADWSGSWAIWELYERSPGDTSAEIRRLWASEAGTDAN